ncbi:hypothetical protein QFC20_004888 [Naganishia adeliensis]|uniref:Uncharacterized protein n=1 Tax=Naganishia adeliensis TaxID=92952 RepID=A0ACC2VUA5_9TREE|nr:hypothetical protein QFC20_004888 [Naganishia adeliensis]
MLGNSKRKGLENKPWAFGRDGVLEIANARGACGNPASGRIRVAVGRATGRVGSLAVQECGLAVEIERVKLWEVVIPVAEVVRSPGRVCALMVMTATSDDVSSDVSQDSATKPNTSPTNKVLFLNLSHYLQPQPTPGLQEGPRYALSSGQTSRTRHRYKHPKSTHPSRCRTNPQARCGSLPEPSLTTWLPLHCPTPTCGSTLGTRNIRSVTREEDPDSPGGTMDGGEQLVETWRLDKYAVEFLGTDENSPLSCNVDEILATEMLEHAQSLGVRKFRLADEASGEEHMSLWLFNPDTDITWGTLDYDAPTNKWTTHARPGKFVTVLWQDTTRTNRPLASERYETLQYPASAVETIRAILAGKAEGVPVDGMTMGEWQVGYLRR